MDHQTKYGPQNLIWTMHTVKLCYPKKPVTYACLETLPGKLYQLLPFPKRILWIGGHTDNFLRKN